MTSTVEFSGSAAERPSAGTGPPSVMSDADGTAEHDGSSVTRWRWWLGGAVAMSVVLRLPMVWTSLGPDEGGYMAIARAWRHGAHLYRDVWVDRPQGLLVLFRLLDWIGGGSTESVRLMAIVFGVLLVVATAIVVRAVAGERAGRYAAVLCAVVTAAPVLEGYAANGELLSGAVSAAAIAIAATAGRSCGLRRWVMAGVVAGIAVSLKQSGFDGVLVVGGWLLLAVAFTPDSRRIAVRRLGGFSLGILGVIVALAVDGLWIGWSTWWTAIAGYRIHAQSALAAADWHNLGVTAKVAAPVLLGSVLAGVFGARRVIAGVVDRVRRRVECPAVMLLIWPVSAVLAFVAGGGFWRHYWIQLGPPIAALAGVGLAVLPRLRRTVLAVVLVPALAVSAWVYAAPRTEWMIRAAQDYRAPLDEQVADWFNDHGYQRPSLYVLCSSPGLYAETRSDPHYPYLWFLEVVEAPHSRSRLVAYLADDVAGPRFVAAFQRPNACDRSGRVAEILRTDFTRVADVDGVVIFERITGAGTPASRD